MLEVLFRRHRFSYPSRRYRKYSERPNIFHKSLLPIHQPLVSAHQSLLSVYQPKEAISFCSSSITQEVAPLCYERSRLCGIPSNVKRMRKSLPFSCFEQKNVVSVCISSVNIRKILHSYSFSRTLLASNSPLWTGRWWRWYLNNRLRWGCSVERKHCQCCVPSICNRMSIKGLIRCVFESFLLKMVVVLKENGIFATKFETMAIISNIALLNLLSLRLRKPEVRKVCVCCQA